MPVDPSASIVTTPQISGINLPRVKKNLETICDGNARTGGRRRHGAEQNGAEQKAALHRGALARLPLGP
jgi:hypothetical protein